ncbi:cytochrome c-type biogenesis protein CcmH/NrfG [Marinomonas alcarazii]|uniref:Cytochrome c-type biogenesis protein CcmH/NrfG n=1 Tax=Marinomonas alcarazii TaxID=491949 RepID=A0A318UYV3_9GAMM|nr:tetratricopeptide repeat protein [Marinomonas alcarazii]PYF81786.1 cytochrome c-type biogenesis protein CcmH/NrfG [Marinomonas alcarazii]
MMIAYLAMASLLVLSLVYLFGSLTHRRYRGAEVRQAFALVRREEIAQEQEAGRLTASEASQLLLDIDHEVRVVKSKERFSFSTDTSFARWIMLGVMAVTVLGSVSLYQQMGYSKEVLFTQDLQKQQLTPEKITDFLMYRSARYDRVEDWYYLANDYLEAEQYQNAVIAFETALEKLPRNAENRVSLLVEYAQAIFYANGGQSSDKMLKVVDAVLRVEPTQPTALDLKGVAEFAKGHYLGAVLAWQEAIRYSAHSQERLALLSAIGKARELGRIDYQQLAPIITDQLAVKITWDASKLRWHQDDVLLVYAVLKGQTMPIAIQRLFPEDLDRPVLLTNLDSLMPTVTLAEADKVDLVVKLANINDDDLTKGQIIGMKRDLLVNHNEIFVINVAL